LQRAHAVSGGEARMHRCRFKLASHVA
jgi:hypothetical protein